MSYIRWRLWRAPVHGIQVCGNAAFWLGPWRPCDYTCRARSYKEAMYWGDHFFEYAQVLGSIQMRPDTIEQLVEPLAHDDYDVREAAIRVFREIESTE